jgi:hypothetical protein
MLARLLPPILLALAAIPARADGDPAELLPEAVQPWYELAPAQDGPNCWGSALAITGLATAVRHATAEEMSYWMESPLCRPVVAPAPLQPGDVIAVRFLPYGGEYHAAVYFSDDVLVQKPNFSKSP